MRGNALWFDGGAMCLDFVGTAGLRRGELLPDPAALREWLRAAALTQRPPVVSAAELADATRLRAAMHAVVTAAISERAPDPTAVAAVNAAARRNGPAAELRWGPLGPSVRREAAPVAALLSGVARELIELVGGASAAQLHECEAPDCSGIFLDVSRAGRRRWCSSATCGNRARVAARRGTVSGPGAAGLASVLWSLNATAAGAALERLSVWRVRFCEFGAAVVVVAISRSGRGRRGVDPVAAGLGALGLGATIVLRYVAFASAPLVAANAIATRGRCSSPSGWRLARRAAAAVGRSCWRSPGSRGSCCCWPVGRDDRRTVAVADAAAGVSCVGTRQPRRRRRGPSGSPRWP